MKRNNTSLVILLTLGVLISCARAPQQLVSEKPAAPVVDLTSEKIRDSIVLIESENASGTGFFVAPDKIATNIHSIAYAGPVSVKSSDKETNWTIEGVVAFDTKNSLVILKIAGEGTSLPFGESEAIQMGASVSIPGYRDGEFRVVEGKIQSIRNSNKWLQIKATKETDGSPVLDNSGRVIGVIVPYGSYAVSSSALEALLDTSMPMEPLAAWQQRKQVRAAVYYSLAKEKLDTKDYAGAIVDFDKVIEIDTEDADAYNNRGLAKFSLGKSKSTRGKVKKVKKTQRFYEAAIADYTQAIKMNPKYATAYKNQAKVKCKLGDIESARDDAEKAQRLYHDGITDYDKYIQLNNPEDVNESAADLASEKVKDSTVRVMSWAGGFYSGSGFFVKEDKVATNVHVVAQSGPVFVKLRGKEEIWAVEEVAAFNAENDLVVLKIAGESIPLSVGDNEAIQSGELVVVVGYPDKRYKVMKGTIRSASNGDEWLRMSPDIGSGGSGSPVLNSSGQVVGIHAAGNEHYGYVIPSSMLKALLVQSDATEPLAKWQNRELIRAYALFVQGQMKYNANHYHEAIADFDKAININAQFFYAYYKRGDAKSALGNYEAAIADYDKAREINDGIFNIYYDLGLAKYKFGDNEAAIVDYDKAIAIEPEHANAYNSRGLAKFGLGDLKGAILDYNKAIRIDPKDADIYSNRGATKFRLGESENARGDVKKAQSLYEAAIADYDKAIQIDPKDADIYSNRGGAKFRLGESENARGDVKKAQSLYEAAIKDCTRALQIDPQHDGAYNNRGQAKEALGQKEAAKADFQKAKELDPNVGK